MMAKTFSILKADIAQQKLMVMKCVYNLTTGSEKLNIAFQTSRECLYCQLNLVILMDELMIP